jgi:hypothetical protein
MKKERSTSLPGYLAQAGREKNMTIPKKHNR